MSTTTATCVPPVAPAIRRVRAYFAPVRRATESPTIFDPSWSANFVLEAPPAPWVDLGWIRGFTRKSATKVQAVVTGSPAGAQFQTRDTAGASVAFQFEQWTKLTMALSAGAQHMNVLTAAAVNSNTANGSGSKGIAASPLLSAGSAADFLALSQADAGTFSPGNMVAVDVDYTGQLGYVGAGVSAAYVKSAGNVQSDLDYVRRVTLNVGRIRAVTSNGLQLAGPLLAGTPAANMRVQQVSAFVDREGGAFFQEFSALFVMAGEQGDQLFFHYPRLQAMGGPAETALAMTQPLSQVLLDASFRALPVVDSNDGERAYCFRTYVPAGNAFI